MSDSHGGSASHGSAGQKSSPKRLIIITVVMLGIAALSFLPALFGRVTDSTATGYDFSALFIPVWLTLTIVVVIIAFWAFRSLITLEKYRDSETPPVEPSHSH